MATYDRKDKFYHKAKREGYLSRAAYKLIEIENKYKLFRKNMTVLDCGAAPGGWSQVVIEKIGKGGKVVGIDLDEIKGIHSPNFIGVVGDIELDEVIENLLTISSRYDLVISDIAPNTIGVRDADHYNSYELVMKVFLLVQRCLDNGGTFVFKLFEGELRSKLIKDLKVFFKNVYTFKPEATRKGSMELYIVAKGFIKNNFIES